MMEALGIALPLFEDQMSLDAILNDPAVEACEAIVSLDGGGDFWLYTIDDLRSEQLRLGGSVTLAKADLRSIERALAVSTIRAETSAGMELKLPAGARLAMGAGQVQIVSGLGSTARPPARSRTVLVFAPPASRTARRPFVIVDKAYVCNKFQESYDQADYDTYKGECPVHAGGVLVAAP